MPEYKPYEACNFCGKTSVLTVARGGVIADRCDEHSTGLRGAAEENRDGTYGILAINGELV